MRLIVFAVIALSIFSFYPVMAEKGCCLNPGSYVCEAVDMMTCCPEDIREYSKTLPKNYSDCIANFFSLSDSKYACFNLPERFENACTSGCCCQGSTEDDSIRWESRVMLKAECEGEFMQWLEGRDDCTEQRCMKDAATDIMTSKSAIPKGTIPQHGICTKTADCTDGFSCVLYNIEPEKGIKRCCDVRSCAGIDSCQYPGTKVTFDGYLYGCEYAHWKPIIDSVPPKSDTVSCDTENFKIQNVMDSDLDCINKGGRPVGGLFHGGLIKTFFGGWCKDDEKLIDAKTGLFKRCCRADYGEEFSWNDEPLKWMTPVKDQGACGGCLAFATIAAAEARYKISNNLPFSDIDFSEQMLISCNIDLGCQGGNFFSASSYLSDPGIADEECFPYYDFHMYGRQYEASCRNICSDWESRLYRFKGTESFEFGESYSQARYTNVKCIKDALRKNGPILFFYFKSGYYDDDNVFRCEKTDLSWPTHAVTIVGWDDKLSAWIFKNSYGTGWGDGGYGKIAYNNCMESVYRSFGTVPNNPLAGNPADFYCSYLGYNLTLNNTDFGEAGLCTIKDNLTVDAWAFFQGKAAQEYSYCTKNGWELKSKSDGKNSFSKDYAVCVIDGNEISVSHLIGLENRTVPIKEDYPESYVNKKRGRFPLAFAFFAIAIVFFMLLATRLLRKVINRR